MSGIAPDDHATAAPGSLPRRALLDFRRGFAWQGARVPVELELADDALRLTVADVNGAKQRRAVERLVGEEKRGGLGPHDPVRAEIPLRETHFEFPRVLGRGGFKFRLPERGEFAVVFSDWSGVEGVAGRSEGKVLYETAKVIRKGPEARRAREAWKAAIESRR